MPRQPKVALYVRVSTDEQSPDSQLLDLRSYVANRDWHGCEEFIDIGQSGSKDSRPAFDQLWNSIRKRQINVLVVHALDRLGRSLPHLVKIIGTLVDANVTLISFRENLDLATAQGRMLAGLFSVLANYELEILKDRTRSGMRAAKARGSQIGPKKRYFDVSAATEMRDRGMGQIKIARALGVGIGRVNEWARTEYVPPSLRRRLSDAVATMDDEA